MVSIKMETELDGVSDEKDIGTYNSNISKVYELPKPNKGIQQQNFGFVEEVFNVNQESSSSKGSKSS